MDLEQIRKDHKLAAEALEILDRLNRGEPVDLPSERHRQATLDLVKVHTAQLIERVESLERTVRETAIVERAKVYLVLAHLKNERTAHKLLTNAARDAKLTRGQAAEKFLAGDMAIDGLRCEVRGGL